METLNKLSIFVNLRPGLEFRDYGDVSAYRSDSRRITQQLQDAKIMISYCQDNGIEINQDDFRAFSGRLSLEDGELSYCTGQYYPTEYRAAVCAVLAAAIWRHFRDALGLDTGDDIRRHARNVFGKGLASRWFS